MVPFDDFPRYVEVDEYIERIAREYPDIVTLVTAGPSYEGRAIKYLKERLWRRTRSFKPQVITTCYGIDANRNFDVNHNTIGVSSDPGSLLRRIPRRGTILRSIKGYVRDILHDNLDRLQLYINMHSFGNWILCAFSDASLPANVAQVHHVGATMGAAMDAKKLPQAPYYLVGNSHLLLYGSSGSAQDYGQKIGVPFSYTLELPEYVFDFRVPPQFIGQISEETWSGIAASARLARQIHSSDSSMSITYVIGYEACKLPPFYCRAGRKSLIFPTRLRSSLKYAEIQ